MPCLTSLLELFEFFVGNGLKPFVIAEAKGFLRRWPPVSFS